MKTARKVFATFARRRGIRTPGLVDLCFLNSEPRPAVPDGDFEVRVGRSQRSSAISPKKKPAEAG